MKKKKVKYEVRYFITDNVSDVFVILTDKEKAITEAKYRSSQEDNRIYFVKMITEQVIFFVGEHG